MKLVVMDLTGPILVFTWNGYIYVSQTSFSHISIKFDDSHSLNGYEKPLKRPFD